MGSIRTQDFEKSWALPENCVSEKLVREALAIVDAINAGELLAALPEGAADRHRHQTAVSLISVLEHLLREALSDDPIAVKPLREKPAE
jgi:hypothetical protein